MTEAIDKFIDREAEKDSEKIVYAAFLNLYTDDAKILWLKEYNSRAINYGANLLKDKLIKAMESLEETLDTIHGEFCSDTCHPLHVQPWEVLAKLKQSMGVE